MEKRKIQCPCCGYFTLEDKGEYDICPVCYWEDDPFQRTDPDDESGANPVTLNKARENYNEYGACSPDMLRYVRKPYDEECAE